MTDVDMKKLEDFAKQMRVVFDMAHDLPDMASIDWNIYYHGRGNVPEYLKSLVDAELAESNKENYRKSIEVIETRKLSEDVKKVVS